MTNKKQPNFECVNFSINSGHCDKNSDLIPAVQVQNRSDSQNISGQSEPKKYFGFTKRQFLTILVFCIADLFSGMTISLQGPFFPAEAEKKGATPSEYGFIFGVFELTAFIMAPIYGMFIDKIGEKRLFNTGIFIAGLGCILFGFLDRFENTHLFIGFAFAIRIFESLGASAFFTSSFTIIAIEFPESVATTFAFLETFFGIGLIIGPVLGGGLYEIGGFMFPFAILGSLLFISGLFATLVMPKNLPAEIDKSIYSGFKMFSVMKVPDVALAGSSTAAMSLSLGFVTATLEPHIREFNLSPFYVGLVFITSGGMYAISITIWGRICDKIKETKYITLIGSILIIIGYILIGPFPLLPIEKNIWLICIGLAIQGIGFGAIIPAGFVEALKASLANGFPDSVSTYGIISGLWTSMFAIGNFVGPSMGGILYDNVGFRNGTLFVIAIQLILSIVVLIFILKARKKKKNYLKILEDTAESDPLLLSSQSQSSHNPDYQCYSNNDNDNGFSNPQNTKYGT